MSIETLDDIYEELADKLGVYSEQRIEFIMDLSSRIEQASQIKFTSNFPCNCKEDWTDGTTYCQQCGRIRN